MKTNRQSLKLITKQSPEHINPTGNIVFKHLICCHTITIQTLNSTIVDNLQELNIMPIYIQDRGFHSALGSSVADIHGCLKGEHESNMAEVSDILNDGATLSSVGKVAGELPEIPSEQSALRHSQQSTGVISS